jgi:hypothetical protein
VMTDENTWQPAAAYDSTDWLVVCIASRSATNRKRDIASTISRSVSSRICPKSLGQQPKPVLQRQQIWRRRNQDPARANVPRQLPKHEYKRSTGRRASVSDHVKSAIPERQAVHRIKSAPAREHWYSAHAAHWSARSRANSNHCYSYRVEEGGVLVIHFAVQAAAQFA